MTAQTLHVDNVNIGTPDDRTTPVTLSHDRIRDLYRSMIHAEHVETMNSVLSDLLARAKAGEFANHDELSDAIPEACDGVLVYSQDCAEYLAASDNADEWTELFIGHEPPADYVRAGLALEADVRAAIENGDYGSDGAAWDVSDDDADDTTTADATV